MSMQSKSGIKDKIAQYWIEKLLVMVRNKQKIRITSQPTHDTRLNKRLSKDSQKEIVEEIKKDIQIDLMS